MQATSPGIQVYGQTTLLDLSCEVGRRILCQHRSLEHVAPAAPKVFVLPKYADELPECELTPLNGPLRSLRMGCYSSGNTASREVNAS
ncbi:hypothetical protein RRG08_023699 [Elysia crispata]|uniref:Uncharacterized protein n=1 Tax=Elysia crispata TaxID=231223 RepID=A0AAE0Z428_9GAST|nr:hypothetical protein RRG08_023699 [Elysia crispata]